MPEISDKMRYVFGKISQAHGGGGYVPSKWIVEETGPENFAVSNRDSGETIAEGIMTHTTASRFAELLNEGMAVNSRRVTGLLGLNLEFEDAMRHLAGLDEASDAEAHKAAVDKAVDLQRRIAEA